MEADVDRMGFDLLVTARGCPYEAATLMLRGGVGLRYVPDGVVARLEAEDSVVGLYPTLIHPVRDPGNPEGMVLYKGVDIDFLGAQGFSLAEGAWFGPDSRGVVLGYEAAELEQRHPGDETLVPAGRDRDALKLPVIGVLERTGTQVDGSVLMPLEQVQEIFGLEDRITGVGIQVDHQQEGALEDLRERYNNDADLQVISLSAVMEALRLAMANLRSVVVLLSWVLAALAALVLLNATLLKSLGAHRRLVLLHSVGFSRGFLAAATLVESLLLALCGAVFGVAIALLLSTASTGFLVEYLPYAPVGNLVAIPGALAGAVVGVALLLGALSTLPALSRIRAFSDLGDLRGD